MTAQDMARAEFVNRWRGSKKRLERIKLRGNWPRLLEVVLSLLALGVIWLALWWVSQAWAEH